MEAQEVIEEVLYPSLFRFTGLFTQHSYVHSFRRNRSWPSSPGGRQGDTPLQESPAVSLAKAAASRGLSKSRLSSQELLQKRNALLQTIEEEY